MTDGQTDRHRTTVIGCMDYIPHVALKTLVSVAD